MMKYRVMCIILTLLTIISAMPSSYAASVDADCPSRGFSDVPGESNWAHEGIDYVLKNGIMNGNTNGTFTPNDTLTRGMLAQIIYNLEGRPDVIPVGVFQDVPLDKWYAEAVEWAFQAGIVKGIGGGLFAPMSPVTREQVATFLYRYAEYRELDVSGGTQINDYPDGALVGKWYVSAVEWAVSAGIIAGSEENGMILLAPQRGASRAVGAAMLMRFHKLLNTDLFTITYELNGGINSPDNPGYYDSAQEVFLSPPSRENYAFQGWYLDKGFTEPVTSLSGLVHGSVRLYAKWYLAPLNVPGQGMEDMIWSWWYYPQVISNEQSVYWGFASSDGGCGVAKYDKAAGTTETTVLKKLSEVDDHNGLALTELEDGRILCAYAGGHNSNNEIHIRISDAPGRISFQRDIVLESSGKTCYCQILQYDGKIHIFYRVNNKTWAHRSSEDGISWSSERILITAPMQYYCKFINTTEDGLIRVCMYSNPTSSDPVIRMGFLDLDTGILYNGDGESALGKERISHSLFDPVITPPEGMTQRMFDVAVSAPEDLKLLYCAFTPTKTAMDSTYYLYDDGSITEICKGGMPLWNPKYQGGASFCGADCIVLARNEGEWDYVELYSYGQEPVKKISTLFSSPVGSDQIRSARPIVDTNGTAVLWHHGYYDPNSYKNFNTDAMLVVLK